jgi:hypothetical protein
MKLRVNEGPIDRIARIAAGAALLAIAVLGLVASPLSLVAGALGAILLLTGVTGFCPLYAVFGVSTCPVKQ